MSKMKPCNTCGAEIAATAKVCPVCGAKNKKPIYKRVWFWVLIVLIISSALSGISSTPTSETTKNDDAAQTQKVVSSQDPAFDGDCGIQASAQMGSSVIGLPELNVSITNTTDKQISAIQFYAVPCDVYGNEITGWTSQNNLYIDDAIPAGGSDSISYQFIEDSVKTLKLYVYSVYFADGSEWGNKDAGKSTILKNGAQIEVSGES